VGREDAEEEDEEESLSLPLSSSLSKSNGEGSGGTSAASCCHSRWSGEFGFFWLRLKPVVLLLLL
jgi:hypothetical protein